MPLVRKSASVTATPAGNTPALLPNLALWLDGADSSTLISDGAASFVAASSQSLSITDASSNQTLRSGNSVYMSCWVRNLGGGGQSIIDKCYSAGGSGSNEYRVGVSGGGQNAYFMMVDGTNTIRTATNSASYVGVSAYAHIGAWHDGQNIYISVNNNTPASVGCVDSKKSTNPFTLGGCTGTGPGGYLTGYIDSAVFCKNVNVSFTDLNTYLYNSGNGRRSSDFKSSSYYLNGNPSGAVSWWDLDERSGTRNDRIGSNHLTDNNSVGYAAGIASGSPQFDGDPISQWSDKSGNNRHLTAPTAAARPTFKTEIQNGRSVLRYDGSDDYLRNSAWASIFNGSNTPYTLFTVAKTTLTATNQVFLSMLANTSATVGNNDAISISISSGNKGRNVVGDWDGSNRNDKFTETAGIVGTNFNLISSTRASTGSIWLNGTLGSSGTDMAYNLSGLTHFAVGARFGGSTPAADNYLNGDIAEVLVYSAELTTSRRQLIEQYLVQKWMATPVVTLTASSTIQHLEWAAVGFATRYEVYYRVTGSNTWTLYTTTTSLWAAVQDLTVGVSYDFRVDAVWSV